MEHIHNAELARVLGDSPNELVLLACADEQWQIQTKKRSSLAALSYETGLVWKHCGVPCCKACSCKQHKQMRLAVSCRAAAERTEPKAATERPAGCIISQLYLA